MISGTVDPLPLTAARFVLTGVVQGVGMRPFVARLAGKWQLKGFVRNNGHGVEIHAEGSMADLQSFETNLRETVPPSSKIMQLLRSSTDVIGIDVFRIEKSDSPEVLATFIAPDLAVCPACCAESLDRLNRRYNYPFVTCADCGPRFSLIQSMPFERDVTSMNAFDLCSDCAREYSAPEDRRFHAQTNACSACGPRLEFLESAASTSQFDQEAMNAAALIIKSGGILAIKGIGGYQLVCDATCSPAIEELRVRKQRPTKPFAVMASSIEEAETLVKIVGAAREALSSPRNPIVVLPSATCGRLSSAMSPGLDSIGVMLPTSSLHAALLNEVGVPCVITSGNGNSLPLAFRIEEATESLNGIADGWLHHNRNIVRPVDDSVVRVLANRCVTIRAARGLAPMPLDVNTTESILATGGHQKVAIALSNGTQSVLGPHIGDMQSIATRQRFVDHVQDFCGLYKTEPVVIAHDLHPDYFTTRWAADRDVQTIAVQHHHAHTVSGMIEHGWLDHEVLGVCFDGSGYGTDGTIWGGEFMVCTADSFRRVARLRPIPLIGGEKAIQEPWRIATALLHDAGVHGFVAEQLQGQSSRGNSDVLKQHDAWSALLTGHRHSLPITSSMGRLFDGVAALLLDTTNVSFEGEAAMRLEAMCECSEVGEYEVPVTGDQLMELEWRPMLREIVSDLRSGIGKPIVAKKFIRTIAGAVARVCSEFQSLRVLLTGGCFQNAVLTEMTAKAIQLHPMPVGLPGNIPPNDGGLAAGQLAVAAAQLRHRATTKGGL